METPCYGHRQVGARTQNNANYESTVMGLSQYTEDELRYAVDIVRIDKRIKEIADYTPLNPITVFKQISEIERLHKHREALETSLPDKKILEIVKKVLDSVKKSDTVKAY